MARSTQASAAVAGEMTADEQAQLDQMRVDDNAAPEVEQQETQSGATTDEPGNEQAGEQTEGNERQKFVPHAALHEERERRKAVEAQAAQDRLRAEERINMLLQRVVQAPPQQTQAPTPQVAPLVIPDMDKDPVGHIVGRIAQQNQAMEQQQQVLQNVVQVLAAAGQQNQQSQAVNQVQQRAMAMEREFAAATPDYVQAVAFLGEHRHRELQEAGWTDPAERQAMISQEAIGIASRAIQMGRNPAEVVYGLAKHRGFQPPAPATDTAAQNNGQRLESVARGQQQNGRSLSNARGSAPPPMTAARLLEMSDADFDKAMNTPEGREQLGA